MPGSDQRTPADPAGLERLRQAVPAVTHEDVEAALRRKVMPPADAPTPAAARMPTVDDLDPATARESAWIDNSAAAPEFVRAPIRTLCPGIEVSADTCDGNPRLAGTRVRTDAALGWADYAAFAAAYSHVSQAEYERAATFEAGRDWQIERRAARKRKRLAKAWRAGRDAAKEDGDGS